MKKTILALLLTAVLLMSCGCYTTSTANNSTLSDVLSDNADSSDTSDTSDTSDDIIIIDNADSESTELPDGWVTEAVDDIYISYPEDDFDITTEHGADFQIVDENGSNVNILSVDSYGSSIEDIDDDYVQAILEQVIELVDPIYEESLGVECETTGVAGGAEIKTFGNRQTACISYTLSIYIPDYNGTVIVDYYQVLYITEDLCYTVTFTHFPYDTGVSAEEYFADILKYLYIA